MKNKIRVYTIWSCCMLGLSACQEDVLVEEVTKGNVTIIGRMSSELTTRTCVDSSSPDGEAGILWSSKDQIGVYGDKSTKNALFEAAKIDGAGHMKIFTSVVLPLGKPILVTMGLFSGLAYWNDWTNGLYYLSGNQGQKLFGIQNLLNQMITDIQYLASGKVVGNIGAEVAKLPTTSIRMAIAFIAMLPLFIVYPFLQKYFSEGITLGAVKG